MRIRHHASLHSHTKQGRWHVGNHLSLQVLLVQFAAVLQVPDETLQRLVQLLDLLLYLPTQTESITSVNTARLSMHSTFLNTQQVHYVSVHTASLSHFSTHSKFITFQYTQQVHHTSEHTEHDTLIR